MTRLHGFDSVCGLKKQLNTSHFNMFDITVSSQLSMYSGYLSDSYFRNKTGRQTVVEVKRKSKLKLHNGTYNINNEAVVDKPSIKV